MQGLFSMSVHNRDCPVACYSNISTLRQRVGEAVIREVSNRYEQRKG